MSKLTASGVTKVYGGKEALSQVSLELEQGKIYGLIGRNGAGKTTLLSVLTAQNPAASGEVLLDGQKVWENPKALSQLCFSRELNQMSGNTSNALKVKEYLRIASVYLPCWDQEMADRLVLTADSHITPRSSINPAWAAALIIAYSPLTA